MTPDERVDEIFAAWRAAWDRGERIEPRRVVAEHPDVAEALALRFEVLSLLDRVVGEALAGSPLEGASPGGAPPAEGRVLGDYRLLREVGRGGMGVVYEAEQVSMRRRVALKVLYPTVTQSPRAIERFRREAQATGRLHHTNIVSVHGIGSEAGTWFYAMDLVEGRPLHRVIEDMRRLEGLPADAPERQESSSAGGAFSTSAGRPEEYAHVARAFWGVADALATAHAAGVVHRDLKPANLLLDGTGTLKIVDFGLARIRGEEGALTVTGDVVGTPAYMSPEQARGREVDARSDVYALGATLYEVLARRPPFAGDDVAVVLRQVLTRDPPPLRRVQRRIPRDLETIVMRAIEKEPERRYPSAKDLAHDLLLFAEGGAIKARPIGPLARVWRRLRRHKGRTLLGAAGLAALVVALLFARRAYEESRSRERLEYDLLVRQGVAAAWGAELDDQAATEARDLFRRALPLAPERYDADVALAFLERGASARLARAKAARGKGLSPAAAGLLEAYVHRREGEEALAKPLETRWRGVAGGEAFGLLLDAEERAARGDYDGALEGYAALLERAPDPALLALEAHRRRAGLALEVGRFEMALEDLHALRPVGHPSPLLLLAEAWCWRGLGRTDTAEETFAQALDLAKDDVNGLSALGQRSIVLGAHAWLDRIAKAGEERYPDHLALLQVRAESSSDAGDFAGAAALYERLVGAHPDDTALRSHWARLLCRVGRGDEAAKVVHDVEAREPTDAATFVNLAEVYRLLHEPDRAVAAAKRAVAGEVPPRGAAEQLVRALLSAGQKDEAEKAALEGMARAPRDPEVFVAAAQAAAETGNPENAVSRYRRALALDPGRPDAAYLLGKLLAREKKLAEAETYLRQAVEARPDIASAHQSLAFVLRDENRLKESIDEFRRAVAIDPKNGLALCEISNEQRQLGDLDGAVRSLREAIAVTPDDVVLHINLAGLLNDAEHCDEAAAELESVASRAQGFPVFFWNRAAVRDARGDVEGALDDCASYAKLQPDDPDPWRWTAELEAKRENPAAAAKALEKALEVNRTGEGLAIDLANLGELLGHGLHRPKEARTYLLRAAKLDPQNPITLTSLANVEADLGNYEESARRFAAARDLSPDDVNLHRNTAWALMKAGEHAKAVDALELGLAHLPEKETSVLHHLLAWELCAAPDAALRDPARAVEHARKSVDLDDQKDPEQTAMLHSVLGQALVRAKRYREAQDELEKARAGSPKVEPAASYALALSELGLGHREAAREAFDRAETLRAAAKEPDPDDDRLAGEVKAALGF